jgi:parvulin-like peptidyl-prolyl isomerase
MTRTIKITKEDIINQVKLSCQLPQIINQIIDRRLVTDAISKLKITIDDEELQIAADRFREFNHLQTAQATMLWLQENSLTIEDLEQIAESSIGTEKLAQKLFSQADIEKYFFEHKINYGNVIMYEIFLDSKDLAVEIFYAIQEGEISFHEAARKYITDPELRRRGGYSGIIPRSKCLPEISAAISTSKPPQLLKPISTAKGTYLIFVEEVVEAQLNPLTIEMIVTDLFFRWLEDLKSEVDIVKAI